MRSSLPAAHAHGVPVREVLTAALVAASHVGPGRAWVEYGRALNRAGYAALRLDFVQPGIARITYDQPGSKVNTLNQAVQSEFDDYRDLNGST